MLSVDFIASERVCTNFDVLKCLNYPIAMKLVRTAKARFGRFLLDATYLGPVFQKASPNSEVRLTKRTLYIGSCWKYIGAYYFLGISHN